MFPVLADVVQVSALVAALALVHRPLGDYMTAVYSSKKHLRVERWVYRAVGANPDVEQRWPAYLRGVLAFSAVSVLFLYLLQRVQDKLPLSLGFRPISPDQAFNTAASFVSNSGHPLPLSRTGPGLGACGAGARASPVSASPVAPRGA